MADRIIMVAPLSDEKQLQTMLGAFYEQMPETKKPRRDQNRFWEHSPTYKKKKQ